MKAPLSFYARNPVGRILNRLSQDINILDELLPYYAYVTITFISPVISTLLLASITNPWLILSFLLSMPLFYFIASIYITSTTDIKRLMLMAAGPIYSHFSNTLEGLKTIRVHSRQKKYTEQVFRYSIFESIITITLLQVGIESRIKSRGSQVNLLDLVTYFFIFLKVRYIYFHINWHA